MQFSCSVEIALPLARVIELFDNSDNLMKWQDGLVSFEHLEGEPGKPGAKSKLVFQNGKRHSTYLRKSPFEIFQINLVGSTTMFQCVIP
ncbi:MAG: hypothetical protein ACI97X_000799 [Oceanospirillaceae bacterium]|jgi:hypothetical protein